MIEVNKSQLAAQLGVKPSMVTKHVKSGVLDGCYTPNGKKLYLEKAIQAISLSRKRGSSTPAEQVSLDEVSGNKETSVDAKILLNGVIVPDSYSYSFHRSNQNGKGTLTIATTMINISVNDRLAVEAQRINGTGGMSFIGGACRLFIKKVVR